MYVPKAFGVAKKRAENKQKEKVDPRKAEANPDQDQASHAQACGEVRATEEVARSGKKPGNVRGREDETNIKQAS